MKTLVQVSLLLLGRESGVNSTVNGCQQIQIEVDAGLDQVLLSEEPHCEATKVLHLVLEVQLLQLMQLPHWWLPDAAPGTVNMHAHSSLPCISQH